METKKKKRFLNIIMILLILVIVVNGVVTTGKIKGWFVSDKETDFISCNVKGVAAIERKGVAYSLKKDTKLQNGDAVDTKKGAQVQLLLGNAGVIDESGNSKIKITSGEKENVAAEVIKGEIFGDTADYSGSLEIKFGGNKASLASAVFFISVQSGSSSLQVYNGDISVTLSDGTVERVKAGEYLSCVTNKEEKSCCFVDKIQIESLNEFQINQALGCKSVENLCFTSDQLQKVLDNRTTEKQAVSEASLKAASETENVSGTSETENVVPKAYVQDSSGQEEFQSYQDEQEKTFDTKTPDTKICTIEIRCDTILNNLDNLDAGKEAYVPSNGCILAASPVEFTEGETVFDVLKRVCDYTGIQLEYSWTPAYDSYYIEGINNLYEFDCGNESGWMYKVNGWFPNYGCSSYSLEDGDVIVWCYTCNGLGADVGGSAY